ncbi:hypothetical protein GJ496_004018 [Pomphorhynchus laevis]|nr:hypothetical protein GJ496_004018 [Pomphorhynchus laevis]
MTDKKSKAWPCRLIRRKLNKRGSQCQPIIKPRRAHPAEVDQLSLCDKAHAEARSCTSVLTSNPKGRDIHLAQITLTFYGNEILSDAEIELNYGRRYGLVGLNGSGKSCLLAALGNRELNIPPHVDIFYLSREMPAFDKTALQCVMEVDRERILLEEEADELVDSTDEESQDRLMEIYERLDEISADKAETRAGRILCGLGFTKDMQQKKCRDFSGGWRMRISLARALFVSPSLLLLDEPTNHLDLEACVWLEQELKNYTRIVVIVSHSQDFMDGICTNIIHLDQNRKNLTAYGGNYEQYNTTRNEQHINQMKRYQIQQQKVKDLQEFVAKYRSGQRASQATSRAKEIERMKSEGLVEKINENSGFSFAFTDPGNVPPPVIMVENVSFRYSESTPLLIDNIEFGVDLDSRVALVGPNGVGKSTLLKLIDGTLLPTAGQVRRNSHLRIARYHQHLAESLDLNMSAVDYLMHCFPEVKELDDMRKIVGRFGLTGRQQVCPMRNLSDGQRCRIVFAWMAWKIPHILLLDEPTNHLDMETIDALAEAIIEFKGGVVLVSHDFRLISQVAKEIWICGKNGISKWNKDIYSYKSHLAAVVARKNKT